MFIKSNKSLIAIALLLVVFLFTGPALLAQSKSYNEEITVIATFDPIIPDAFKINQNPLITDTSTAIPVMKYTVMPRDAGIQLDIDPMPAVKLVAEPLDKLYRNYIKGGAGNYSSLYGELFASSLRSKSFLFGVHLKHESSSGKIKDYAPSGNSRQLAELFGQKYFPQHTLSGKFFFERRGLHQYGFKPEDFTDTILLKDDLKQRFITGGGEINFLSTYKGEDKLNHNVKVDGYLFSDLFKLKENTIRVQVNLDKKFDLFKIEKKQSLGLNTSLRFMNQRDSSMKQNVALFRMSPYMKVDYKEYSFRAGVDFYVASDSSATAYIFPVLEAKLELIPGALQLYAGIDGGIERLTYRSLSEENPYISSVLPLNYSRNKFRAYGGFHSNISRNFNFNGSISSTTIENYPFFITDSTTFLKNTFTLLFDDISVLKINGELEFVKTEKLRIGLAGGYYNYYKLGDQLHAWYKPDYDLAFNASYDMQKKILLRLKVGMNGPVWAKIPITGDNPSGTTMPVSAQKINGWWDVSLGGEYRFSKALSFWLNVNNITNSQHMYWYNYPSYRLNFMGGASFSF